MSELTSRVCEHCGAPLRGLVDGYCPYCRTRSFAAAGSPAPDAPTRYSVLLLDAGGRKIEVIKQLRVLVDHDFGTDLGLKEAKDLIDRANPSFPPALIVDVEAARAGHWAQTFAAAGASVDVRPSGTPTAAAPATGSSGAGTTWGVYLLDVGKKKINVIKEIRGLTGLGLAEAKDVADGASGLGRLVVNGLAEPDARAAAARLASAGAAAEIRPA